MAREKGVTVICDSRDDAYLLPRANESEKDYDERLEWESQQRRASMTSEELRLLEELKQGMGEFIKANPGNLTISTAEGEKAQDHLLYATA